MPEKKHPGKISFFENVNGTEKLVKIDDVKNMPESMRFRKDMHGKDVPVVKTVAMKTSDGNIREIIEYGPNDQFLASTMAAPPPPQPRKEDSNKKPKPAKSG
nr:hypothetical protein [Candidatus Sigynarchaeota archaeon]